MSDPSEEIQELKRQIALLEAREAAREASNDEAAQTSGLADSPTVNTGGGAMVGQSVRVGNGHFVGRDLIQHITQMIQPGESAADAENLIALYLHTLVSDLAGLRLGEIDGSLDDRGRQPLQLADVYVPLFTTLQMHQGLSLKDWLSGATQHVGIKLESRRVDALEALAAHPKLVLLGKPGGGKSSFGARVLLTLAQTWRGDAEQLTLLGETWDAGALIPLRVTLRKFADQLPPGDAPARAGDIWDFVGRELRACGVCLDTGDHRFLQRLALRHGALVLFDGLDECGDAQRRGRVRAAVDEFMATHRERSRFLLTARPYAWPEGAKPAHGVYELADFSDAQIQHFVRTWYGILPERGWCSAVEAERMRADLEHAIVRPDPRALAPNPLLLTLMALLHSNRGTLPDDRVELYDESVELLLQHWNRTSGADQALRDALQAPQLKLSDVRVALQRLAFEVHEESTGREGALDISQGRLVTALAPLLAGSHDKALAVVEYIERRAGLLLGQGERRGERQFSFPHRTFQEYLAACHLAASTRFSADCLRLANADASHWAVVLPLAARVAGVERGASAADGLIGSSDFAQPVGNAAAAGPEQWTLAYLAGLQLVELGASVLQTSAQAQAILKRVQSWLVAALPLHPDQGGLPASTRAKIGDVLAQLGDPRFDPQRFFLPADEQLGFVRIAADPEFRIGTRQIDRARIEAAIGGRIEHAELNEAQTPTPEFYIARYPVTVGQFRVFASETKRPLEPYALAAPDNRPVSYVTWHDALAYALWLQDKLLAAAPLDGLEPASRVRQQGWRVDLPTALEWEKAARGGPAEQAFSWDAADPERANIMTSGIDKPCAVGAFTANQYGIYDALGSVWEWTGSHYRDRYDASAAVGHPDADEAIEVRGGSWYCPSIFARCAYRLSLDPGLRLDDLGFRVALRSAPVP